MTSQSKICAVVVTYNRLELLKLCIDSLKKQTRSLDEILIINNSSTDGTEEWLEKQNDLIFITQENTGGAGGFHTGIKTAFEKGFDWIWCMDDDSMPLPTTLYTLLKYSQKKYAAVCPLVIDLKSNIILDQRGYLKKGFIKLYSLQSAINTNEILNMAEIDIDLTSFVGPLINTVAVKSIGLPKSEYFIHNDDIEYSLRLNQFGSIMLIPSAKIIHKAEGDSEIIRKHFMGKTLYRKSFQQYWVKYFTLRNFFATLKLHYPNMISMYLSIVLTTLKELIQIILFDNYKLKRIRIVLVAMCDGITNRFDRKLNIVKEILYSKQK
ncbi:MAG: glycosyltransferase [Stygiobacter sp.]|nr:MAG: glycosyltransferase [Stygiobacter sp.]